MQYLLTEQEYKDLLDRVDRYKKSQREALQDLCTKAADHVPVNWGWGELEDPKPWGCILSTEDEWYCDSCPAKKLCPHPNKEWSK